ncbi:hypothetical protein D9758_004799 [Tetrapyrgos nigripes]|uniref:Cytochrome P450 n=1 Tax=Tetrapyrgos nigripes TaxID=182062 RepID=A0A8H5G623_9AGAR|nr:hypothetical protein D9758_004799 [Tetrapyrgos nigripes]
MSISNPYFFGIVLFSVICYYWIAKTVNRRARFPPGPKRLPLIGSLLNTLPERIGLRAPNPNPTPIYQQFLKLGKECNSDIIHIDVLGDHTVVLNSAKAVTELLDHRGLNYSGRPAMPMLDDLMGWGWDFGHMGYSDRWRRHRKTFTHHFQPQAIREYHSFQRKSVTDLLNKLLTTPEPDVFELKGWIQHYASSVILRATYGIASPKDKEYYVELAQRAVTPILHAGIHGTYLVDYFPLLKYVPSWFPGAGFKRKAKVWAQYSHDLREKPWETVQSEMNEGTALPCFVTRNLGSIDLEAPASDLKQEIEVIKNCAGVAYIAGSDTSISLIRCVIVALLIHPEVQERAQAELDSVLGTESNARLPNYSDREDLPYLNAIISETLRFYPITPLAVPHQSLEDDVYEGYHIPKGSTILGNCWAILHDEQVYPDPMTYDPSRFMKSKGATSEEEIPPQPDAALYGFGFGRRICPGRWLALDTTWLIIACILATCTIKKPLDSNGKEIVPVIEYEDGLVVHLKPYKCRFVPRSEEAVKLMKDGFLEEEE